MTENNFVSTIKDNASAAYSSPERVGFVGGGPVSHQEAASYRDALSSITSHSLQSAHQLLEQMDQGSGALSIADFSKEFESSSKDSVDAKTGRHVKDLQFKDGTTEHEEFDAVTGKMVSDESKDAEGHLVRQDFDPTTGNKITETESDPYGHSTSCTQFDPVTGNRKSSDNWDGENNSSTHTEYDFAGKPISSDTRYMDGDFEHKQYYPGTATVKFSDYRYHDGGTMHEEYDPSGREVSSNAVDPDGTSRHTARGPNGKVEPTYPNQTPWWELNPIGWVDRLISQ
jgi:hypothetical protein